MEGRSLKADHWLWRDGHECEHDECSLSGPTVKAVEPRVVNGGYLPLLRIHLLKKYPEPSHPCDDWEGGPLYWHTGRFSLIFSWPSQQHSSTKSRAKVFVCT